MKACLLNDFLDHKHLRKNDQKAMLKYANFRIFIKLFITSNLSTYFEKDK